MTYVSEKVDRYFDNHGVQTEAASAALEALISQVIEDCAREVEGTCVSLMGYGEDFKAHAAARIRALASTE